MAILQAGSSLSRLEEPHAKIIRTEFIRVFSSMRTCCTSHEQILCIDPQEDWLANHNTFIRMNLKVISWFANCAFANSRPSNADWPIKANADHHASVLHSLFCPHFWGIICCDFVPPMIPITTTSSVAYSKRHISDITLRQCSTWGFPLREGRLIQPYSHSLKTSVA